MSWPYGALVIDPMRCPGRPYDKTIKCGVGLSEACYLVGASFECILLRGGKIRNLLHTLRRRYW